MLYLEYVIKPLKEFLMYLTDLIFTRNLIQCGKLINKEKKTEIWKNMKTGIKKFSFLILIDIKPYFCNGIFSNF